MHRSPHRCAMLWKYSAPVIFWDHHPRSPQLVVVLLNSTLHFAFLLKTKICYVMSTGLLLGNSSVSLPAHSFGHTEHLPVP